MNLQRFKQDYDNATYSQKKQTVLVMLESLLWKGENFDTIYYFILQNPHEVTTQDLDEVFWVLIVTLYKDSQQKLKRADSRLESIRQKMLQLKEQERIEKKQDDADVYLDTAFSTL